MQETCGHGHSVLPPGGAGKRQNLEPTKSHHELLHCAGIAISGSLRFRGRRETRCPSRFAEPDIALAALAGLDATLFMPRDDKVAYNAEVKRIVLIVREKFSYRCGERIPGKQHLPHSRSLP